MATWEITVETAFRARHKLRGVPKEKAKLHAHEWTVRASLRARSLNRAGWVIDFEDAMGALQRVLKPYEDRFLNELSPFDSLNPTREKIARVLAEKLTAELDDERVRVYRIDISEGAYWASYIDDD